MSPAESPRECKSVLCESGTLGQSRVAKKALTCRKSGAGLRAVRSTTPADQYLILCREDTRKQVPSRQGPRASDPSSVFAAVWPPVGCLAAGQSGADAKGVGAAGACPRLTTAEMP